MELMISNHFFKLYFFFKKKISGWLKWKDLLPFKQYLKEKSKRIENDLLEAVEEAIKDDPNSEEVLYLIINYYQ